MKQTNTTNRSFINVWHNIQDREVEPVNVSNNGFMLELKNEKLDGIELENLSDYDLETELYYRDAIREECQNNVWYFFREILRIPNDLNIAIGDYTNASKFNLTGKSLDLIWAYNNGYSIINQSSDTESVLCITALYLYDKFIRTPVNSEYFTEKILLQDVYKDKYDKLPNLLMANSFIFALDPAEIENKGTGIVTDNEIGDRYRRQPYPNVHFELYAPFSRLTSISYKKQKYEASAGQYILLNTKFDTICDFLTPRIDIQRKDDYNVAIDSEYRYVINGILNNTIVYQHHNTTMLDDPNLHSKFIYAI